MADLTQDQLLQKLRQVSASMIPAAAEGMEMAALNVEGEARKNCDPGNSPYESMEFPTKWKGGYQGGAPYMDDRNPDFIPPHLRDSITHEVQVSGSSVQGLVETSDPIAEFVHNGTSKMQPRPFLEDAGAAKIEETTAILSAALARKIQGAGA
jgi:HK97 gp10 family phage protein